MIEVKELTKRYGRRYAIDGLSFSIQRGEVLGFLGPNGAGKSTTMKILSGFIYPSTGTAKIDGFDVREDALAAKALIGYLPEQPPVYMQMTVTDYIDFAAGLRHVPSQARKEAIQYALKRCGLLDVQSRIIGNLSKGYRQRVGLAQAIVHNPPVLILDEPTVGLDPKQIIEIRDLIRELGQDHTIILSTHILSEVQVLCSRVIVIDSGKIRAQDTISGLAAKLKNRRQVRVIVRVTGSAGSNDDSFRDSIGVLQGVDLVERQESDEMLPKDLLTEANIQLWHVESSKEKDMRSEIAKSSIASGFELLELRELEMSLEDAFVKLIDQDEASEVSHA